MGEFCRCPICGHDTFENEYGDIQCINCRTVLPIPLEVIKEKQNKN